MMRAAGGPGNRRLVGASATLVALAILAAVMSVGASPAVRIFVPLAPRTGPTTEAPPAASVWQWQRLLPTGNTLRSASFGSDTTGWTVGDAGTILVSSDGGATWTPQGSGTTADLYRVVAVSPTVAWASGAVGTVLRTEDGGATWRTLAVPTGADLRGLAAASATTAWVVGTGGAILGTSDGGATWARAASPTSVDLFALTLAPSGALWASGGQGTVLRSTDGGGAWMQVRGGPQLASHLTAVAAASATTAWAFGHTIPSVPTTDAKPITVATTDGGVTWVAQAGVDAAEAVALSPSTVYADGSRTTDGGATWASAGSPIPVLGVAARGALVWTTGTIGTIARSVDGAQGWSVVAPQACRSAPQTATSDCSPFVVAPPVLSVAAGSPSVVYAATADYLYGNALLKTTDGGATWARPTPAPTPSVPDLAATPTAMARIPLYRVYGVAAASPSRVWLFGDTDARSDGPRIFGSVDGGGTWTGGSVPFSTSSRSGEVRQVVASSVDVVWASGPYGVARSADAGRSWTVLPGAGAGYEGIAAPSDTVAVAVGPRGTIAWTTDAGATWSRPASDTTADLRGAAAPSTSIAWAVGSGGTILRTSDGGATWTVQASGSAADLRAVAAVDAQTAWAVGTGGVVLATTNGGTTWTPQWSGTRADLYSISAASRDAVWVVGDRGAILKATVAGPGTAAPASARVPGQTWTVQERLLQHPFTDTWTRRGTSTTFDAVQTNDLGQRNTFVVTVNVNGLAVTARRRQSSDANDCDYTGALAPDLRTAAGTYRCAMDAPGVTNAWTATIG